MAVENIVMDVLTTPTAACYRNAKNITPPQTVEVVNTSGDTIYWGGPFVSTTTGTPIEAGASMVFVFDVADENVFLVTASSGQVKVGYIFPTKYANPAL